MSRYEHYTTQIIIFCFILTELEEIKQISIARVEVFTAKKVRVVVFWVTSPSSDVVGYQLFGGTRCLHLLQCYTLPSKVSCSVLTELAFFENSN